MPTAVIMMLGGGGLGFLLAQTGSTPLTGSASLTGIGILTVLYFRLSHDVRKIREEFIQIKTRAEK